ncbi:hypothetical protein [Anaerotignum sp.]
MSTFTEHYNLIKPGTADYYDIADWNENMDAIDEQLAAAESAAAEISEKIGTPAEEGQTLFGLLQNTGLIKSIQKGRITLNSKSDSGSIELQTVDPAKCFVSMLRLRDGSNLAGMIDYTLRADGIDVTIQSNLTSGTTYTDLEFWVVEFC